MSNKNSNWPTNAENNIPAEEMGAMCDKVAALRKLPEIDLHDPDAIGKRIDEFFDYCIQQGLRPSVTLMASALGCRREQLWRWEQEDSVRGHLISQAKGALEALTEQWFSCGKINPTAAIFILKNNFSWRDDIGIIAKRDDPPELPSAAEIKARLTVSSDDGNASASLQDIL